MVLDHDLSKLMTLITFAGNQPVFRGGKVGTGGQCCCGCSCGCSSEDPPFVSESCELQKVVLQFDLSQLGACTGAATVEITAADEDKFFPWSKRQEFSSAGGLIVIQANMWCVARCVVVRFNIFPTEECDFCGDGGVFVGQIEVTGVVGENGICCPAGGTYAAGPNIPFCSNETVQFSVDLTFVY